jgi:hypothetical protein
MKRRLAAVITVARRAGDRGATLVEYSLGIALVVVVSLTAIQSVEDNAGDELSDRGGEIGHPSESGGTGGTTGGTTGSTGGTTGGSTGGDPVYTGTVEGSCTGGGNDRRNCTFSLSPDPSPTTPTWSILPSTGFTGTLPTITFTSGGSFTVRAQVGTTEVTRIVECTANGNLTKIDCELQDL